MGWQRASEKPLQLKPLLRIQKNLEKMKQQIQKSRDDLARIRSSSSELDLRSR
jgi:hypothetical protein